MVQHYTHIVARAKCKLSESCNHAMLTSTLTIIAMHRPASCLTICADDPPQDRISFLLNSLTDALSKQSTTIHFPQSMGESQASPLIISTTLRAWGVDQPTQFSAMGPTHKNVSDYKSTDIIGYHGLSFLLQRVLKGHMCWRASSISLWRE